MRNVLFFHCIFCASPKKLSYQQLFADKNDKRQKAAATKYEGFIRPQQGTCEEKEKANSFFIAGIVITMSTTLKKLDLKPT